jgi:hypothetical protein
MDGLVAQLWEQLVEVENIVGEVIVSARAGPLGLAVASPIERRDAMPRRDELARDGVEAPSDVEEAVAKHHIDGLVAPTNDVMRKAVRGELLL